MTRQHQPYTRPRASQTVGNKVASPSPTNQDSPDILGERTTIGGAALVITTFSRVPVILCHVTPVILCHLIRCLDQHFSHRSSFLNAEFETAQAGYHEHKLIPFPEHPDVSLRALLHYSLIGGLRLDRLRAPCPSRHPFVLSPVCPLLSWVSSDAHTVPPISRFSKEHSAYAPLAGPVHMFQAHTCRS